MVIHDLTHSIETGMPVFPGDPAVTLSPATNLEEDGVRVTDVHMGTHTGTHIDAPSHTKPEGRTIDEFPPDAFVFEARLVDLSEKDAREAIQPDELPTTDADILVVRTGWDDYWETDRYYDHPYVTPAAAKRCAQQGHHLAVDALNPDPTPTENADEDEPDGFPAHGAILGAGLFIIENLMGLRDLPKRFTLHAQPLRFVGGDGSPVRAVAVT